jgi:hypothetical protein
MDEPTEPTKPTEPTVDPYVVIEEQYDGYVRYRRITDGRRWEVFGTCDHRGDCMVGAVVDGIQIQSVQHLNQLIADGTISMTEMDTPVTPEFRGCCPFTYNELESA